jgi:hypothetical protein
MPSGNDLSRVLGNPDESLSDGALDAYLAVRETVGNSQGIIARRVVEARW